MKDWVVVSVVLTALLNTSAALLAWGAKLRWSREYRQAKDEIVRAKDAEIDTLRVRLQELKDLTPMRLRDYFISTKQQLEEYNEKLRTELRSALALKVDLEIKIDAAKAQAGMDSAKIEALERECRGLRQRTSSLESRMRAASFRFRSTPRYGDTKRDSLMRIGSVKLMRRIDGLLSSGPGRIRRA